jgi:alkanesulfonate monooxygenase SsuD/methylene tetrahydromethanopterin reductase-like flavin-dependent oxidoreductase (luciferase family)
MQYGIILEGGDFRRFGELAGEAEAAGWDAVFVADALAMIQPFTWFDPWVVLTAMAMSTERIRIGTMITPPSRRRPWKLARETATLDHLSNGRVILSVGLGAAEHDAGFCKVGEEMDLKVRAQMLDESLAILDGLWRGKPFKFSGEHYNIEKMTQTPAPVQKPRIPIWVIGVWPKDKSMQRALRWDGIIPQKYRPKPGDMMMKPADIAAIKKYVDEHRKQRGGFDILAGGPTPGKSRKKALEIVRAFEAAGATWWIESAWSGEPEKVRTRIKQGPPRS